MCICLRWALFTLVLLFMRSLGHITLHPLLASLVHLLLTWLWVIISLPVVPSLKHFSPGWPAWWLILKVPDSQRGSHGYRKEIHVVNSSYVTICWPTGSICFSSTQLPAPCLLPGTELVCLQTVGRGGLFCDAWVMKICDGGTQVWIPPMEGPVPLKGILKRHGAESIESLMLQ